MRNRIAPAFLVILILVLCGCATEPIVLMPLDINVTYATRDESLTSVEMRTPLERLHRTPSGESYLMLWRGEIETCIRDHRVFTGKTTRSVRLVMNPLTFEETGFLSNVRIVMDYSIIDSTSGAILEHYIVESTGYSAIFDGSIRTRTAWQIATQANIRQFLLRFARRDIS